MVYLNDTQDTKEVFNMAISGHDMNTWGVFLDTGNSRRSFLSADSVRCQSKIQRSSYFNEMEKY